MSILSITIRLNTNVVTDEILCDYYKVFHSYLENIKSTKYVCTMEKGSASFLNHIQCMCMTTRNSEGMRQYLKKHMKHLPGYNSRHTIYVGDRTKYGNCMFAYPMKEEEKLVCDIKGISDQEMETFLEEFAQLPDFKAAAKAKREVENVRKRRNSFKYVKECAEYLWDFLPDEDVEEEIYHEKPVLVKKWVPDQNRVFEYDTIDKRFVGSKDSGWEGNKCWVRKKGKELIASHWEEEYVSHTYKKIGVTKSTKVISRKWMKKILIERGVELEDTTFANTYMKHFDSIKVFLEKKALKHYQSFFENEDLVSSDVEDNDDESSLGIELSTTNSTSQNSGEED